MSANLARLVLALAIICGAPAAAGATEDDAAGAPDSAKLTANKSPASPPAPPAPGAAPRDAAAADQEAAPRLMPAAAGGAPDPGSKCAEFPMMCAAE